MKTSYESLTNLIKAGLCALALASVAAAPAAASPAGATKSAHMQVKQDNQDRTAKQRKKIVDEAVAAVGETRSALKDLDENKTSDALSALEQATGKLEIILARDPKLALAPTGVTAATYNIYGTVDAVKAATRKAENLLDEGRIQDARRILHGLASETDINVTNIPLATYPAAIKQAASLIGEGKTKEAKEVLQSALNTMVVTQTVIPLPVVTARQLLKEAEKLAGKQNRSANENKRLTALLDASHQSITMAETLGYGSKEDFSSFYKELSLIEDKTSGGKSGAGFFDKIKDSMAAMFSESQHGGTEGAVSN